MNKHLSRKFTYITAVSCGMIGITGALVLSGIASSPRIFAAPVTRAPAARISPKMAPSSGVTSSVAPKSGQASSPRVLLARGPLKLPTPPAQVSTSTPPLHLLRTLDANAALTLSFSSDSQTLASTPMSLELWDVKSGKLKTTLRHNDYPIIASAVFSPVEPLAAVLLGNDRTNQDALVLWNIKTGQIKKKLERPNSSQSAWRDFAFSPDGKRLATVYGDKRTSSKLLIWDVKVGKVVDTLSELDATTNHLAFSPDGKTLAGASQNRIQLWNASTGKLKRTLTHPDVTLFAFAPDGKRLASVSANHKGFGGVIKLWNVESDKPLNTLSPAWYTPKSLVFASDGRTLIVGGGNYPTEGEANADGKREYTKASGTIAFYDAKSGKLTSALKMPDRSLVTEVTLSPDGKTLASGEFGSAGRKDEASVRLWNLK